MTAIERAGRRVIWTAVQAVPTIIGIIIINFFLFRAAPGDAADAMAAESGSATAASMQALRHQFGLDMPVLDQLFGYFNSLAHFNLGVSPRFNLPVAALIWQRLPSTFFLMSLALIIAVALGLLAGSLMAVFAGRLPDRILSVISLLFYSTPVFWVGLMLIVVFSVNLGWLPSGGSETLGANLTGIPALMDRIRHLILPATSLALFYVSVYARLTRAAMIEAKAQDYVRTARAKGLSPFKVTTRHVLRNALLPITTVAGMHVGSMLGGVVVVETVFSWPGIGQLAFDSVMARDFSVLFGILLLSSLAVIGTNLAVDLLQVWLDPRIGSQQ